MLGLQSAAQNFSVRKISTADCLSNNCVMSIAQDKNGYMWIATEEGLNRFDGYEFEKFFKNETLNSLSGNELNCIIDDKQDSIIWIATQRAGLNAYNYSTGKFSVFKYSDNKDSISSDAITKIAPSSDGNIWISTYWGSVDYYDKRQNKFQHFNNKTVENWVDGNIWTVAEDFLSGRIYIGYSNKGFAYYDRKNKVFKSFKVDDNNEVLSLYVSDNQDVWVGTRTGLLLFDYKKESFKTFNHIKEIENKAVFDIKLLKNNKLWLALELGGIAVLDLTDSVSCFAIKDDNSGTMLSGNSVRCITSDKYGNVWAGIWSGGINFINLEGNVFDGIFFSPDYDEGKKNLNCKSVLSTIADKNGQIWVGTDGGGINVFKNEKLSKIFSKENSEIQNNFIQAAFQDYDGNLWFGLYKGGIAYWDKKTEKFTKIIPEEYAAQDVRGGVLYDKENILVATGGGILKLNTITKKITDFHKLPHNDVRCVLRDSYNRIWAGTFGGGLFVLDTLFNTLMRFETSNNFPSNTVNQILEDSLHRIWVATGEGLVLFSSSQNFDYKVFNKKSGLSNSHIRAIAEDNFGDIWISSNGGISCLCSGGEKIKNYGSRYNIPAGEFSSGAVTSCNGKIYFGSTLGLCIFRPEDVLKEKKSPQAKISKIKIFLPANSDESNRFYTVDINQENAEIVLKHYENNFAVSVFVDNYAYSGVMEYASRLEGAEKDFYIVNDPENVAFRNLAPGNYTLEIKTRFISQSFETQAVKLKIKILPPWYLTVWALIFYCLMFLSAVYFAVRSYKRRVNMRAQLKSEKANREKQEALNEEKMRFYTNIAHEIRTPLSLIAGPLEDLAADNSLEQSVSKKIKLINRSSQKLLKLANNLLDLRKTETDNKKLFVTKGILNQVVEQEMFKYQEFNRNEELKILWEFAPENFEFFFDQQCIITILDNLVSNALKYTPKGFVKVTLCKQESYAVLAVEDTGYGISKEALPHIFERYYQEQGAHQASGTGIGLSLCKSLTELHQGKITVESEIGKGTVFQVFIPINGIYGEVVENSVSEIISAEINPQNNENIVEKTTVDNQPLLLVVEDNADIQEYINISLSNKYKIISAFDGKQGIETALKEMPDIIISDIMMPIKNGIELCQTLKNDVLTSHIPIILLTAKDSLADKTFGYEAGADSYLTKPFSAALLISRIENLLEKKQKLQEFFRQKNIEPSENKVITEVSEKQKDEIILENLGSLYIDFLNKTDQAIKQNIEVNGFGATQLAAELAMSTSSLYKKLKAITGLTTVDYIRKIKMQTAAELLSTGKYSVSETAFKIGITSEKYFRRLFKEEFGVLPSEYGKKFEK